MSVKKALEWTLDRTLVASLTGTLVLALGLAAPQAHGAELVLSDTPLFLGFGGVEPNIIFTIDDSGSMQSCWNAPDGSRDGIYETYTDDKGKRAYYVYPGIASADINLLYYNPDIAYVLPPNEYGLTKGMPKFGDAHNDGYTAITSNKTKLKDKFAPCRSGLQTSNFVDPYNPGPGPADGKPKPPTATGQRAYYLSFTLDPATATRAQKENWANYTQHVIGTASDPSFGGDAAKQEDNFAIWFTYYRIRFQIMKSAAFRAFSPSKFKGRMRLAMQGLWGYKGSKNSPTNISLMRSFKGQGREDFFTWLAEMKREGGTPLAYAMHKAGLYYSDQEDFDWQTGTPTAMDPEDSPWAFDPGNTDLPRYGCRTAYHVMMSDGYWNNEEKSGLTGNYDGTSGQAAGWILPKALPDTTTYTPIAPYKDSNPSSSSAPSYVADVAFKFWATDLQPDVANEVPAFMPDATPHPKTGKVEDNPKNDPATWQHMVNFLVAFGIDGKLPVNDATYNNLLNGTTAWTSDEVDDLWHAAINSRGKYLSAKDPDQLADAFESTLDEVLVVRTTGSSSAVAVNTTTLTTSTKVFQGVFDSGDWSGKLFAYPVNADGSLGGVLWDAGIALNSQDWDTGREILTYNADNGVKDGVPFRWNDLSATQQTALDWNPVTLSDDGDGWDRLKYLRGDDSNEGSKYRARLRKLGDIVHSAPFFVGVPPYSYPDTLESVTYSSFATANKTRTPMVYVGANDGMLHGFNADTGAEVFAYVPRPGYGNLSKLTSPAYSHRYFVDGDATVVDAFVNSAWMSVLAGSLGRGGQGIYALDVTDPTVLTEGNADNVVLWEFTDADDPDLGYTYGTPVTVKMANGKWAVVFANGYNNTEADGDASTTGHAVLYIAFIEGGQDGTWTLGADYIKLDTEMGDPTTPNGLATPAPVDVNGDEIIDYIYAGDQQGNMWKFLVNDPNPAAWRLAYGNDNKPQPLISAVDGNGDPQPITNRPNVGLHPAGHPGYAVYFTTGKFLEIGDNTKTGQVTQSAYGIWDKDELPILPLQRKFLLEQKILQEVDTQFDTNGDGIPDSDVSLRAVTKNSITWHNQPGLPLGNGATHMGWYLDMVNTEAGNTDNFGERMITNPLLRTNRLIFTTMIPSSESSCTSTGGDGWLMEIDANTGGQLAFSPFDLNNDLLFTTTDYMQVSYDVNGDGVVDVNDRVPASGIKQEGIPSSPVVVSGEDPGDPEVKFLNLSTGVVKPVKNNPGPGEEGRQAWRRLR